MESRFKIVPLIPLEKVVLFPRALMSIQMPSTPQVLALGDYIAQDAELCLALHKKNNGKATAHLDRSSLKEVYHTACIGRVVNKEIGTNNQYKILIEGVERARILEEIRRKPIVLVKVEIIHDFIDITKKAEINAELQQLLNLTRQLGDMLPHFKSIIKSIIAAYPHPAIIADLITYTFIKDPYAKLSILEELDTLRRIKLVAVQMRNIFHRLSRQRNRDIL